MSRILCNIEGVDVTQEDDGRVHYIADADIDADGANGQNGRQPAYTVANSGSEDLANGGMMRMQGKVVFAAVWGKDIVLWQDNKPMVLASGIIPSRTAYRFKGKKETDPGAYVDAETVPYMVVSPMIRLAAKGIVLGCKALCTNIETGRQVECVVADIGPKRKIGELSIAAARGLAIPSSPRTGGVDQRIIKYELWPGHSAVVAGIVFDLLPA